MGSIPYSINSQAFNLISRVRESNGPKQRYTIDPLTDSRSLAVLKISVGALRCFARLCSALVEGAALASCEQEFTKRAYQGDVGNNVALLFTYLMSNQVTFWF